MDTTVTVEQEPDSGYLRLEQQINWYDKKSNSAQVYHKWIKIVAIFFAVLVPLFATFNAFITGIFGVMVVILEALQQTNQWHSNWITYRSTCEALRHEKYAYIGTTGVYENLSQSDAKKTLIARVESLVSTEHAKWISRQEYQPKKQQN